MIRRPPENETAAGRRLTFTPIGFDIVIALSQMPQGMRLSRLSHAIGSPLSSVQAALRILVANDLAERDDDPPPSYRLVVGHPAHDRLVALARVLAEPAHALAITLRANDSVVFAVVDATGFVAAVAHDSPPAAQTRLAAAFAEIGAARNRTPPVELNDLEELTRLLDVSIGLRARVEEAVAIKGRPPQGTRSIPGVRTASREFSRRSVL